MATRPCFALVHCPHVINPLKEAPKALQEVGLACRPS